MPAPADEAKLAPAADTANRPDFLLRVKGLDADDLRVAAFDGVEGISELYEFRIELVSTRPDIDPEAIIGLPATLEIAGEHGIRYVHGIIRRFELIGEGSTQTHYEASLVPAAWLLTQRIQSRTYQKPRHEHVEAVDLVSIVFHEAGMPRESLTYSLNDTYEEHDFFVQYRESDWDFINRILEQEGAYYYFDHREDDSQLIVVDHKDIHVPYALPDESGDGAPERVPYRDPNGLLPAEEFVYHARFGSQVCIGSTSLDDFNFRDPPRELRVRAEKQRFSGLVFDDYPGGYDDKPVGQRRVDRRLQEQQTPARVGRMSTTVRQFRPGTTFRLVDHPSEKLNIEYLITRVTHRATQGQSGEADTAGGDGCKYEAEIEVIPADVQYRAPRSTPRPIMSTQTAIVVGPPGEEIYTDAYGRVKVRFHWDQQSQHDENGSCWIRVSQGWAGGQYGMLFLPRVGQEVIVEFLEGDPDRPIITGRVYNKDHMPPYKLPDRKTVSAIRTCSTPGAGGGNEIRFDDAKGEEQLLLFAQNTMHLRARGSRFENVGGNFHRTTAKDAFELVKENKHSTVKLDRFEQTEGSLHERVEKDVKESVHGRKTTFVNKKYAILNSDGIVMESDTGITLRCKGNFIQIDDKGVTIVAAAVNINSGGAAMTWEWDSPDTLTLPRAADTTEFGRNVRYQQPPADDEQLKVEKLPPRDEAEPVETITSWIEIELVDEEGRPAAGEEYSLVRPDGQTRQGRLNEKGQARVGLPEPGECQISFPNLDRDVWERA